MHTKENVQKTVEYVIFLVNFAMGRNCEIKDLTKTDFETAWSCWIKYHQYLNK